MDKWKRILYQPSLPLGKDGKRVTGSPEHILLSKNAAIEGMVLLKNENSLLPFVFVMDGCDAIAYATLEAF